MFQDHYEELLYITHPRRSVIDNVDKMLGCGDPSFGGAMYGCTSCGNLNLLNCLFSAVRSVVLRSFHKENKLITETIPALEFMERLVQHIPGKNKAAPHS
ncbi:MAG: transposase zinc-binding domain-containing protein [Eubacterium sp.]